MYKKKYREAQTQDETEEETLKCKQKAANYKRKYRETKKQCESQGDLLNQKQKERKSEK